MKKRVQIDLKGNWETSEIAQFVQISNRYASKLYVEIDENRRINAKSIMGMMSFLSEAGQEVTVSAQGEDEAEAIEAIVSYLAGKE